MFARRGHGFGMTESTPAIFYIFSKPDVAGVTFYFRHHQESSWSL